MTASTGDLEDFSVIVLFIGSFVQVVWDSCSGAASSRARASGAGSASSTARPRCWGSSSTSGPMPTLMPPACPAPAPAACPRPPSAYGTPRPAAGACSTPATAASSSSSSPRILTASTSWSGISSPRSSGHQGAAGGAQPVAVAIVVAGTVLHGCCGSLLCHHWRLRPP